MLDKTTVITAVEKYAEVVKKELSPDAVVLYGSHAKDNARDDSDIDVAVVMNGYKGDWLETSALLWHLSSGISYDIEPILVDASDDKSGFVKHIFKTGRVIYSAQ